MAKPTGNFFVPRSNLSADGNHREYDTLSQIAEEWLKRNPDQKQFGKTGDSDEKKSVLVQQWMIEHNDLKNANGKECGKNVSGAVIFAGKRLELPAGNEIIDPEQHRVACAIIVPPVAPEKPTPPAASVAKPIAVPVHSAPALRPAPAPRANGIPVVQKHLVTHGAKEDGVSYNMTDFFIGRPPQDVAAEVAGRADLAKKKLNPHTQEGVRTDLTATSNTLETIAATINALRIGKYGDLLSNERESINTGRAPKDGELEFAPEQSYEVDDAGRAIKPNREKNQKLEEGPRLQVDADGKIRTVYDAHALISKNRRDDPEYSGVASVVGIREARTAENRLEKLTNTGEGNTLFTTYMGYERLDKKLSSSYFKASEPSAQDAEKLLQLNVQAALHPLVWSVAPYEVPVKKPDALRAEMQRVVDHLPPDERNRLTEQYIKPYSSLLKNPTALNKAIDANGGRADWVNPMQDWKDERLKIDYIAEQYDANSKTFNDRNYGHLNGDDSHDRSIEYWKPREKKYAEAYRYGNIAANKMWDDAIRPPTKHETKLGMGLLHDAPAQQEDNLAKSRLAVLDTLAHDPKARAAWADHMLASPSGIENVSNLLFYTSNENTANYSLLGYKNAAEGRKGSEQLATALAGKDRAEDLMHYEHNVLAKAGIGTLSLVSVGLISLGKNVNQNNGHFGFVEETKKRWEDPATRGQVDAALKEIVERSIAAQKAGGDGSSISSTSLALTLDPQKAESEGTTQTYDALLAKFPAKQRKAVVDQSIANLDNAGNRYVTADVDLETKRALLHGENIATVNAATAEKSLVNGSVGLTAAQAHGGSSVLITTLDTDKARAAINQGEAVQSKLLATSQDTSKVSQNQLNAHVLNLSAKSSPSGLATMVVGAIKAADASGNKQLAASLRSQVDALDNDLSDKITAELDASKRDPNRSVKDTRATFDGYFAGNKAHALEAVSLAANLGTSINAANAVVAPLKSDAHNQENALLAGLPNVARAEWLKIGDIKDPVKQQKAFKAFGTHYVDQIATLNANNGVSVVEVAKLALLIAALTRSNGNENPPTKQNPPQNPTPETPLPQGPVTQPPPYICDPCTVPTPPITHPPVISPPITHPPVITPDPVLPMNPLPQTPIYQCVTEGTCLPTTPISPPISPIILTPPPVPVDVGPLGFNLLKDSGVTMQSTKLASADKALPVLKGVTQDAAKLATNVPNLAEKGSKGLV